MQESNEPLGYVNNPVPGETVQCDLLVEKISYVEDGVVYFENKGGCIGCKDLVHAGPGDKVDWYTRGTAPPLP
jgi:hypothetical protein